MADRQTGLAATYRSRRRRVLRDTRRLHAVDALLISNPYDIRYLCGLTEGSPALLIGDGWSVILTSAMFQYVVPVQAPGSEMVLVGADGKGEVAKQLRRRRARRVGIQPEHLTLERYQALGREISERRLVPLPGVVAGCRAVKSPAEIAVTRKAIRIAEEALRELMGRGAKYWIGRSEQQLATELEYLMRSGGADRQGFPLNGIIVGAGPNSASCHHVPTSRKVKRGDGVLVDWGAELDGYRSDMTRVVFIDSVPARLAEIYPIVRDAMNAAIAVMRPGVSTDTVDSAARDLITRANYGKQFCHGLGHGIGLQIHESPFLGRANQRRLRKDMIITVEPGIYIDVVGGIRLEDDILITGNGHRNLCTLPTRLDAWVLQ